MNIEYDIFKRYKVNIDNLIKYGFTKIDNGYQYNKKFMDNNFLAIIKIINNQVSGRVFDLDTNLEYTNIRLNKYGEFTNLVRESYKEILFDIRNNCFSENSFIYKQSNEVVKFIKEKYNVNPEFLWEKTPGVGVFRNSKKKWFAIIMNINGKIFSIDKEIEVINVKVDDLVPDLLKINGIYEAYHMNKKKWISIILDETLDINFIFELIDKSYNNILK